jgi:hypothetical protein
MLPLVNAIVTLLYCVYLMQSLHHILLDICKYLMMQSSLWQMVRTRTFEDPILDIPESSAGHGRGQVPCGNATPPTPLSPVCLEQMLATQNHLMGRLVKNDERHGAERQKPQHQDWDSSYLDFLATHPPVFIDPTDPLEVDNWLYTTESKFGLLQCTEFQKICTQLNNCEAQLEPSVLCTLPPYLLITTSHGASSILLSVFTTCLRVCSTAS